MNMLCVKLLILLVLTSSLVSAYRPDNSENTLGDTCKLENNEKGICSELSDCESAKKLFKLNKTSDILHCAFIGRRPIVCCPNGPQQLKNKNPKFIKALCMNTKPDLVINFNIVNGLKADVGEFPYQVALGYRGLGSDIDFRCGGSLIAEDIVISAAHCANKKTDLPVMVRLGRTSLNLADTDDDTPVVDIDIERVKIHLQYSRNSRQNDIALIKLKKPVNYTKFVQPICLSSKSTIEPNENFTITGFGTADTNTHKKSDWLLKGTVNEFPLEKCKNMLKKSGKDIVGSQFCAQSSLGVDGCQGDSGGPMAYEQNDLKYLFGIISYGSGCGSPFPGIYTRVDKYLDWIESEMTALG